MSEPLPCPGCGRAPTVGRFHITYEVACPNYDGAPDSAGPHSLLGYSISSMEEAIADWGEQVEAWLDSQEAA